MNKNTSLEWIEENVAMAWLAQGTIWITDIGEENVYFLDEFDQEYFTKPSVLA